MVVKIAAPKEYQSRNQLYQKAVYQPQEAGSEPQETGPTDTQNVIPEAEGDKKIFKNF